MTTQTQIAIHPILTASDAKRWRADFVGAYQTVFSNAPYYERHTPSEAEAVFQQLITTAGNITLIAADDNDRIMGFAAAVPLAERPDVVGNLHGLVPAHHAMYFAELAVLDQYRGQGIGKSLTRERLNRINRRRFTHVVLRVADTASPVTNLYRKLGFDDMGVSMTVQALRQDGRVSSDQRTFMSRVLSQVSIG